MHSFLKVSIVIPVYNGEKTLNPCLNSLIKLDYPKEYLQIIVVDNNSTDSTKEIVSKYPVKYVFESKRSYSSVRNRGVEESDFEFIAFIDADCIADEDWLKNLILPMENEAIGGVGGKIVSFKPKNLIEKYIDYRNFYAQCGEAPEREFFLPWIVAANSLFRKSVLKEIGMFDSTFSEIGGEDVDLVVRIVLSGKRIGYASKALVSHSHRSSIWSFYPWRARWGRAAPYLFLKYKNIINITMKEALNAEINRSAILFISFFSDIFKNIFTNKGKKMIVFSFLDFTGSIAYFFGYMRSWFEASKNKENIKAVEIDKNIKYIWWDCIDSMVLIDLLKKPSKYHQINETGKRIWELLTLEGKTLDEVIGILIKEYDESFERVKTDADLFLTELKKTNIFIHNDLVKNEV